MNTQLARVTIAAPRRRIDLALPEQSTVAELLPTVLAFTGDAVIEESGRDGGWSLRRPDGTALALGQTLAAQRIRDGEILHLAPRREDWPEGEYDDVIETVAEGTRRLGRTWHEGNTRVLTLVATGVLLAVGLLAVWRSSSWTITGAAALVTALVLLGGGVVTSRVLGDSVAGAVVGALALPYGVLGGLVVLGSAPSFGGPQLLIASTSLLVLGMIGYVGVAESLRVFGAAAQVGALGVIAGVLAVAGLGLAGVAATVVCLALALGSLNVPIAMRIAGIPVPELPQTPGDLLRDAPQTPQRTVYARVRRADELVTGMVLAQSIVAALCVAALLAAGSLPARLLAGIVALVLLLRTRGLPAARQRIPTLVAGGAGAGAVLVGAVLGTPSGIWMLAILFAGVLPLALVVLALGLAASRRRPSPVLGRVADIVHVALGVSVVPVALAVLGLYGLVRGLGG